MGNEQWASDPNIPGLGSETGTGLLVSDHEPVRPRGRQRGDALGVLR